MRSEVFIGVLALALSIAPLSVDAACVGGAKNGVVEAGEQCDGGATDNCCKPDCTWRPVSGTQAGKCVDPGNPCQQGSCQADHSCNLSNPQAVPGHPSCANINSPCLVGECYNTVCKEIGNENNQWAPRCPPDSDPCHKDECRVSAGGQFIECRYTEPSDEGTNCSTVSGTACVMKECDGEGNCEPTEEDPPTCSGSPGVCEFFECLPGDEINEPECVISRKHVGADCDTNAWDCKHQQCKSSGACGNQPAGVGERCDPNTDNNHCYLGTCGSGTSCNELVNVDPGVVQFVDPPSPPLCPDNTVCTNYEACNGSGGCTRTGDASMNGVPCESDNNSCSADLCNSSGTCMHNTATNQGQPCTGFNSCAATSTCVGLVCTAQTCNTTGNCNNCSSFPPCTNGANCGCQ
jgi:hypothetical protein